MLANDKCFNALHVTPAGKSLYARVQSPDTRFDNDGIYHVDLLVEPENAQPLITTIERILEQYYNDGDEVKAVKARGINPNKAPIYEVMTDGSYRFRFKQKAVIRNKAGEEFAKNILVVDAGVKPFREEIGNGSTVKVSYRCKPYYVPSSRTVGVSLRLVGVQVLDYVSFGDGDCGFTNEEGFDSDAENVSTAFTAAVSAAPAPATAPACADEYPEF